MKKTTTEYYCDVTGKEIDDLYEMIVVTVHRSAHALDNPEAEFRLSKEAHGLAYERIMAHDYDAYLDENGSIAMIEETDTSGPTYFGRNTSDQNMARLMQALEVAVQNDKSRV